MAVYLIGNRVEKVCKIGVSENPVKRLAQLQTGCPHKLSLLRVNYVGDYDTEAKLHKRFKEQRIQGEWFCLTDDIYSSFDSQCSANGIDKPDLKGNEGHTYPYFMKWVDGEFFSSLTDNDSDMRFFVTNIDIDCRKLWLDFTGFYSTEDTNCVSFLGLLRMMKRANSEYERFKFIGYDECKVGDGWGDDWFEEHIDMILEHGLSIMIDLHVPLPLVPNGGTFGGKNR
jgi:hypothetical protein